MSKPKQLSDLQIAILRVLWQRDEATVAQVQDALRDGGRELAHTSVATMLSRLESRGVVDRRTEGRQFVYRPLVAEDEVKRSMVSALTERLFAGDPAALVHHLIDEGAIDAEELARLRRLVAGRDDDKPERRKGGRRG